MADAVRISAALATLSWGNVALQRALDLGDPSRKTLRVVRHQADARRDVVVLTEGTPQQVEALAPLQVVTGTPAMRDLAPLRRLFVIAPSDSAMVPFLARFGAPSESFGVGAKRWDLQGISTVKWSLIDAPSETMSVRREGPRFGGPCRFDGWWRCNSADDWNHPRTEQEVVDGSTIRCFFAHPQDDGPVIIEARAIPASRAIVGAMGINDASVYPAGAPVRCALRFEPEGGGAALEQVVITPNTRGLVPYRIETSGRSGTLRATVTLAHSGARAWCLTAQATE